MILHRRGSLTWIKDRLAFPSILRNFGRGRCTKGDFTTSDIRCLRRNLRRSRAVQEQQPKPEFVYLHETMRTRRRAFMTIRKKSNAASCLSSLIIFTALLLSCSAAFSQQGPIAKACVADLKAQCAGIQPGDGRIKACIKAHFADVSKNCLAVVLKAA